MDRPYIRPYGYRYLAPRLVCRPVVYGYRYPAYGTVLSARHYVRLLRTEMVLEVREPLGLRTFSINPGTRRGEWGDGSAGSALFHYSPTPSLPTPLFRQPAIVGGRRGAGPAMRRRSTREWGAVRSAEERPRVDLFQLCLASSLRAWNMWPAGGVVGQRPQNFEV